MASDRSTIRNVYVPTASICLAIILMLIEVSLLGGDESPSVVAGLSVIAGKTVLYGIVLLLGMGLCSWCGHPFDPLHLSLLQLLAVTLGAVAVRGTLAIAVGPSIATFISLVYVLGLTGYFFSDEPMNALIAIFLAFAAHVVTVNFLLPLVGMIRG